MSAFRVPKANSRPFPSQAKINTRRKSREVTGQSKVSNLGSNRNTKGSGKQGNLEPKPPRLKSYVGIRDEVTL